MNCTIHQLSFLASLLLIWSTVTVTRAQHPNIVWQRSIEDYPNNVQIAAALDGSVGIICTSTSPPYPPIVLTKLNANGNLLWRSQITGSVISYIAQVYLLTATRDGGFVIICRETVGGSYRRFVLVKFNSAGTQLWLEPLADYYEDSQQGITRYNALIEDSDGGILIGGGTAYSRFYNPFVEKYTSLGKYERNLGIAVNLESPFRPRDIGITAIAETNNGYAVSGLYYPNSSGFNDPSVGTIRYINREGVLVNTVNFPNELSITGINFDRTDNSLVATSRNSQGWGVLKLNNIGEVQFRSIISRKTNEQAAFVKVAPNPCDGYIVADTDSTSNTNFRVTRIGRDGSMLSSQTFGGQQAEYVRGLALQANGTILLAGTTLSIDGDLVARQSILPVPSNPVGWILSVNYLAMGGRLASILTGNWNLPTTWNCGRVPTITDQIQVSTGHVVNLNQPATAKKLLIQGTIRLNAGSSLRLGN